MAESQKVLGAVPSRCKLQQGKACALLSPFVRRGAGWLMQEVAIYGGRKISCNHTKEETII